MSFVVKGCFCLIGALVLGGIGLATTQAQARAESPLKPGTREMAKRLREINEKADAYKNNYLSDRRVPLLRQAYEESADPKEKFQLLGMLAGDLLNAGRNLEAAEEFNRLKIYAQATDAWKEFEPKILLQLAMCYLRLGEIQNCLNNHSAESCLFPIQGGGVHRIEQGSRRAVGVLTELLEHHPNEAAAVWLLNVAYMTLGEYPDQVPPRWRIPANRFQSSLRFPEYPNIASGTGLDAMGLAGGSVADDFNNDGLLDVMASSYGLDDQLRLFINQGDGTFADRTDEWGLTGVTGGLNLNQTDYDNDGRVDILVLRGAWFGPEGEHPNSLLKNIEGQGFEDVTIAAGIYSLRPTQTAAWFDYNKDGWLDLFVGNESNESAFVYPCELFRNNKDGTFTECAAEMGLDVRAYVKGAVAGDFNNDGLPDLYLSCLNEPNLLFRNDGGEDAKGEWRFTEIAVEAGVQDPERSFPAWFWDYDNDGWQDLFVANYSIDGAGSVALEIMGAPHSAGTGKLFRNKGDGTFEDVSGRTGLDKILYAMGSNYGDLNNDGFPDFYIGTGDPDLATLIPNRMFLNSNGESFREVTYPGRFGHLQKGHGVSFADFDNDGDQDVHAVMGGAYPGDVYHNALFLNPGHGRHWIKLCLEGERSNRLGVGARIKLTLEEAGGKTRTVRHIVRSGGSFGANPLRRSEIGLGDATRVKELEIYWPGSGKTKRFQNVPADRLYLINENADELKPLSLNSFEFALKAMDHSDSGHGIH